MELIEKFFLYNPKKQVCITDLFKVRRGRIVEDVLKHTDYKSTINEKSELDCGPIILSNIKYCINHYLDYNNLIDIKYIFGSKCYKIEENNIKDIRISHIH